MTTEKIVLEDYEQFYSQISEGEKIILRNLSLKQALPSKTLLSFMLLHAVQHQKKEWIEQLIKHKDFELNALIDKVNNKTLLASIIYYPFYEDLFKKLIDMGAEIYKDKILGDYLFRSNALMLSVHYGEFGNLEYLLEKGLVSNDEVLSMCIEKKNFVLLRHFLERTSSEEARVFIRKKSSDKNVERVQRVLEEHLKNIEAKNIA